MKAIIASADKWTLRLLSLPPRAASAVLVVMCLVIFLPGFITLPPVDRDEVLFAQAAKQMVESGDYVDIRVGNTPRYKKPVGIYWLQAATFSLAREIAGSAPDGAVSHRIWVFRLPSLLAAIGAVLGTALFGWRLIGPKAGLVAGTLLASSFMLGAEARLAKTDAVLLLTIIGAQYVVGRLYLRHEFNRLHVALFWAAIGASVLVKGPVGVMVVGLCALSLCAIERRVGWLRPLFTWWGVALALAIALPWYGLIYLKAGEQFLEASIGDDMLAKMIGAQESHGAPPGSYFLVLWATFFPASLYLIPAIGKAFRKLRTARQNPALVFLLAWVIPTWFVFELIPTKLVHYVLPTYPALALLIALFWEQSVTTAGRFARILMTVAMLIPVAVLLAIALNAQKYGAFPMSLSIAPGLLAATSGVMLFCIWRGHVAGLLLVPVLSFTISLGIYPTLARLPGLWPSVGIARLMSTPTSCGTPSLTSLGYDEKSLMFLTGTRLTTAPKGRILAQGAITPGCAMVAVEQSRMGEWRALSTREGWSFRALGQIDGLNLATGKPVSVSVFAAP